MELTTKLTKELFEKAKRAESAEALRALAKENDCEMSEEEAEAYFAQMHKSGELSDEELENVSGGGCRNNGHLVVTVMHSCDQWKCKKHKIGFEISDWKNVHTGKYYRKCPECGEDAHCVTCDYCKYEKGLWLCYNPQK